MEGCNKEIRRGFQGRRILDGVYVVEDQGDVELVVLVAGLSCGAVLVPDPGCYRGEPAHLLRSPLQRVLVMILK